MPQLFLEYSPNILEQSNFIPLFNRCHRILADMLPTEINSCKSRAIKRDIFCVGDGDANRAFVHVCLKVLPGRTPEVLTQVAEKLMEVFLETFAESYKTLQLQITLEVDELAKTYFKVSS